MGFNNCCLFKIFKRNFLYLYKYAYNIVKYYKASILHLRFIYFLTFKMYSIKIDDNISLFFLNLTPYFIIKNNIKKP